MTLKTRDFVSFALIAIVLAGCASSVNHAPISDRRPEGGRAGAPPVSVSTRQISGDQDWRPPVYVVQKGDTLYGIAFNYGLDYHELADLNNIENPDMIEAGQELRLFAENNVISVKPSPPPQIEAVPLSKPPPEIQVVPLSKALPAGKPAEPAKPPGMPVIIQPLAIKLPYSADAAAQIARMQGGVPQPVPAVSAKAGSPPSPATKPVPPVVAAPAPAVANDDIEWGMPTSGKIITDFSQSENRKGIDVAGKIGQPILASAAGKVVYSGSGLRGYGKLIIIKHNRTYLSAYAHNDRLLVKEGEIVAKGQKIAEMGNSDADQVALHFEIRKLGKPVDPAKYLPMIKS